MRTALRALAASGGTLGALTALIGFAHTPAGRPLLAYLPGYDGCPVGADVTPEVRDAARSTALAPFRGESPAAGRPALGLTLGRSTRDEVATWAASAGGSCAAEGDDLRCAGLPAGDVLLRFDAGGQLAALDATLAVAAADDAVRHFTARSEAIAREAGPPTDVRVASLTSGPLSQSVTAFHYADYKAEVVATNLGHGRFKVREVVQSVPR